MRIVFMGSSQASATCLHAILRLPGLQVVGVVTQPDRPAGRGRDLTPCPCRKYARGRGIVECITPENVNTPEAVAWLREKKPDVIAVVAFGQFLKDEILEMYLNTIYYGSNYYGIGAASEGYFGKRPRDLALPESAMLAGLPNAPSLYSPYVDFMMAKKRQFIVLDAMVSCGYIDKTMAEDAKIKPLYLAH